MINSMTGFGSKEAQISPLGKVAVEIRSTNHKFLETILHAPDGFLSLEEKVKKEIESKLKRGRVTCAINITGNNESGIFINKDLLAKYIDGFKEIKKTFGLKDEVTLDALIRLPGVLSLAGSMISKDKIWPNIKPLVSSAIDDLLKTRQKEGKALQLHLKRRAEGLKITLSVVRARFKKAIKEKLEKLNSDEERSSFLKNSDITEEIERLAFHISNLNSKLTKSGPIGKELDFIAQEMQREANTIGAKSCDSAISAKVVEIKSQIEKIREQVQNIE